MSEKLTLFWWHLPFSRAVKERIKDVVFKHLKILFINTRPYKNWKYAENPPADKSKPAWAFRKPETVISGQRNSEILRNKQPITSIAVVVHVFYPDAFLEILKLLKTNQGVNINLYVSAPAELSGWIIPLLNQSGFQYRYKNTNNRGRDILPFLTTMHQVIEDGHGIVLKLHTKKSRHLKTGKLWRQDLYNKLIQPDHMQKMLDLFNKERAIGMVGPENHIVPMNLYYGANAAYINYISRMLGVEAQTSFKLNFVAGTMFYARIEALLPLLYLGFQEQDFEKEEGQLDGTLAHAIERAFAISVHAAGYDLADTTYRSKKSRINKNYRYCK